MRTGDMVRIMRVPEDVRDSAEFRTRSILEKCVGRAFPVMGFNAEGMIQIDVGEVVGKPAHMESIWIETDCLETVSC